MSSFPRNIFQAQNPCLPGFQYACKTRYEFLDYVYLLVCFGEALGHCLYHDSYGPDNVSEIVLLAKSAVRLDPGLELMIFFWIKIIECPSTQVGCRMIRSGFVCWCLVSCIAMSRSLLSDILDEFPHVLVYEFVDEKRWKGRRTMLVR